MKKVTSGGGWPAIRYTLAKSREVGGPLRLWRAMRSKNACKTCALGMGGQHGGMVNEAGQFPEVCKKSLQAMAADMQPAIPTAFWGRHPASALQRLSSRELESCGRLVQPVLRTEGGDHYVPIAWDEAVSRVVDTLMRTPPDRTFWYSSGRSGNEAAFLLQLFARLYGTNNVNNCSYFCHQASGVGLQSSIGTGTATVTLDDLEETDLVFLIGGNPASNHPRLMTTLMQVRRRGGDVIVINPVVETGLVTFRVPSDARSLLFGSSIASLYVQPHIGGDLALLTGIAKRTLELSGQDDTFLGAHTTSVDEWRTHVGQLTWAEIEASSGVTFDEITKVAERYVSARRVVFAWTMGITHHAHGVDNVQAIANLALVRGMIGRRGTGLLPIRGHSNVQGIGSMGVTPALKQAVFDGLERALGVTLPTTPGLDTLGCIEAAMAGRLTIGVCLGGNLYGSNPDSAFARQALGRLDLVVYLSTTLNTGHAHGLARNTLILPVLARDEEPQATTQESMFNYVRLSDGGPRRHDGPRSEVDVLTTIAERTLGPGPIPWSTWRQTRDIRQTIAQVVPGFEALSRIDETQREFHITGRVLHEPRFPTPDGRALLHRHALPPAPDDDGSLRLMTVRSEGQFNTVVYEEVDIYRGQNRRDVVLLNPEDMRRLGLLDDAWVTVSSDVGAMAGLVARTFPEIRAGNALMYYPEANVLVPRTVDERSRTPAFKHVRVRVAPAQGPPLQAPAGV